MVQKQVNPHGRKMVHGLKTVRNVVILAIIQAIILYGVIMKGKFTANGETTPVVSKQAGLQLSLSGSFGGGSVAVEKNTPSGWVPLYNSGVAESFTAPDDVFYNTGQGIELRLVLTGASAPSIDWMLEPRG